VIFRSDPAATGGADDWFTTFFDPGADVPIYPSQGVQVARPSGGDLTFEHAGELDENERMISLAEGVNVVPIANPVGYTLDNSGWLGAINKGGDPSTGDTVTVLGDPLAGGGSVNFEADPALTGGATGWFDSFFAPSGSTLLEGGTGVVFNRLPGTGVLTYSIPAPVVGP
jgi:hypothetical protein